MPRLTSDNLHGIWGGITIPWDRQFRFDEETYAANIEQTITAGVAGIYTTGSTSEFYTLDFDEFCRMVDLQVELCGKANMPLQIGCCSDATHKTIRMLEYAASKPEVGAAQVCIPYWMELSDHEVLQFFKDLHVACPDLPLMHYNIPRTKRFLHAADYLRILEVVPNLIGVKYTFAGSNFAALQSDIAATPQLSYFIGENLLVSAMQLGARGSCSSLVFTNPIYTLDMYQKAADGKWDDAMQMQKHLSNFLDELIAFIIARGEGTADPVVDKGMAVAAGFLKGHQRCRPPYIGWSDETVTALREWMLEEYPEFVYNA